MKIYKNQKNCTYVNISHQTLCSKEGHISLRQPLLLYITLRIIGHVPFAPYLISNIIRLHGTNKAHNRKYVYGISPEHNIFNLKILLSDSRGRYCTHLYRLPQYSLFFLSLSIQLRIRRQFSQKVVNHKYLKIHPTFCHPVY